MTKQESHDFRRGSIKIRCINAYQVDLPLYEGSYNWSGGEIRICF